MVRPRGGAGFRSRRVTLVAAVGVLGAIALIVGILMAVRPADGAPASVSLDAQRLSALDICSGPCHVTGQVEFTHPVWGPSLLATVQSDDTVRAGPVVRESHIVVVDAAGQLRWRYGPNEFVALAPADPPVDGTGHIFVDYDPGRYNGVIILGPAAEGFDDFTTLPALGDFTQRFYSARVKDDDRDGIYEVSSEINVCDPACASGNYTRTTYRWNGRDYVPA